MTELDFFFDFILYVNFLIEKHGKYSHNKKYIHQLYSKFFKPEDIDAMIDFLIDEEYLLKTTKREVINDRIYTKTYFTVHKKTNVDEMKKVSEYFPVIIENGIKMKTMNNDKELIIKSKLLKFHQDILDLEELEQYEACSKMMEQLNLFIETNLPKFPNLNTWNKTFREIMAKKKVF